MKFALILLVLLAQEEDPVSSLVEKLDHGDLSVREEAALALRKKGASALDPLRKVVEKPPSVHVRAAVKEIIGLIEADLRRANFKGGKPVGGLSARLTFTGADARKFRLRCKPGKKISVQLEVMNVGETRQSFMELKSFDRRYPESISSWPNANARIEVRRIAGKPPGGPHRFGAIGGKLTHREVVLDPGSSSTSRLTIEEKLSVGTYEIRVVYYTKTRKLIEGVKSDLVSSKLTVQILEE